MYALPRTLFSGVTINPGIAEPMEEEEEEEVEEEKKKEEEEDVEEEEVAYFHVCITHDFIRLRNHA